MKQTSKATTTAAALMVTALALSGCVIQDDSPINDPSASASAEPESAEHDSQDTDDAQSLADRIPDDLDPRNNDEGDEEPTGKDDGDEDGGLERYVDTDAIFEKLMTPEGMSEDAEVYFTAQSGFSPTLTRWVVDGDPAGDLVGTEIEVTRWNCKADVQADAYGDIAEGSYADEDDVYDIEWIAGENPNRGGGTSSTMLNITINERILREDGVGSEETATSDHERQFSRFSSMCGDLVEFLL